MLTVPYGVGNGVVLEVAADGGKVELSLDAGSLENRLGTDAAQLENLRSVDGTRSQHNFLLRVDRGNRVVSTVQDLDSLRSQVRGEDNLSRLTLRKEVEVGAVRRGIVVGSQR